ncbi:type II toxin-antitoxin system death-on-curing family toxin [Zavarzinia compransoris]|uniref:Type II toxin-antitoxin system death-on-curing family toxin n=1 Tax=Zavarzinia compransoris TaxID=1264899 RepID=A0A317E5Q2_9PROT|nr:type II toxin-antitoxin system death-on-curing family toxin [Zavarzinia compransoris]PWR20683.1 type II toxin-antitoxin system death-on-curing family toxin [Zavarzinia compransoris]TDP44494.1 death-on-curing protein [Zavarzinia compransoris]
MTPRWLSERAVLAMHAAQIVEHGGGEGVRDLGLLASALARALNLVAYGDPDLPALAAAYAFGIARNHPFVDGNKRTAFVVAATLLALNGMRLRASEKDVVETILALAAGRLEELQLAEWFRHWSSY